MVSIDWAACGLGTLDARVSGRGRIDVVRSSVLRGCAPKPSSGDATFDLECKDCVVHAYTGPHPPRVTATSADIYSGVSFAAASISAPHGGLLSGMAVIGERLVVSGYGGESSAPRCPTPLPAKLHFLRADDLTPELEVDAPSCTRLLVSDPTGTGFFALHGSEPVSIARFDAAGALVATATIAYTTEGYDARALVVDPRGEILGVGLGHREGALLARALLIDSVTLAPVADLALAGSRVISMLAVDDAFLVGLEPESEIQSIELHERTAGRSSAITLRRDLASAPHHLMRMPSIERVLVASDGDFPVMHVLDQLEPEGYGGSFEAFLAPTASVPWPGDTSVASVMLTERTAPHQSSLALFDALAARFLPGLTEVGVGPSSVALRDASGNAFYLLPWSARVVRVPAP